ncbi:MAG: DNA-binding response regulator [Candidatus Meridianibacter frigidus]|nr:MAG: DNA-binding response regulator [Candidatus Eremiobacteraeota bacterium]
MIGVSIIDDHPVVRDGLRAVLEMQHGLTIANVVAVPSSLKVIPKSTHVVLLDWELEDAQGGVGAIQALRKRLPDVRIVVFSAYAGTDRVTSAFESGACGYVLKGAPADEIIAAVRSAANGSTYLGRGVSLPLQTSGQRLTGRETQVLNLIARGLSTGEIARALHLSERTVKFHVTSILGRLGATRRAQAVSIAKERGLI